MKGHNKDNIEKFIKAISKIPECGVPPRNRPGRLYFKSGGFRYSRLSESSPAGKVTNIEVVDNMQSNSDFIYF